MIVILLIYWSTYCYYNRYSFNILIDKLLLRLLFSWHAILYTVITIVILSIYWSIYCLLQLLIFWHTKRFSDILFIAIVTQVACPIPHLQDFVRDSQRLYHIAIPNAWQWTCKWTISIHHIIVVNMILQWCPASHQQDLMLDGPTDRWTDEQTGWKVVLQ